MLSIAHKDSNQHESVAFQCNFSDGSHIQQLHFQDAVVCFPMAPERLGARLNGSSAAGKLLKTLEPIRAQQMVKCHMSGG